MENTLKFSVMAEEYLNFCTNRKNLDSKTIKSYRIDLRQYQEFVETNSLIWCKKSSIERYIDLMHSHYKPKSVKRKIASIKAFFHYLEIEELLEANKIATASHFPMNVDVNSYNITLYILISGASVLTLLVIFGFYIFLKSNINRKTTELALYRSLGYTSANIFYIVFVEHFITGVLSLIIGLISAEVINSFLVNPYIHNLLANTFMDMSVHIGIYQVVSFAFVFVIVLLFTSKKAVERSEKIDLTILLRS